jgi:large subunit ribosomal protein L15
VPRELNLSSLKPAQKRVARKRVGRGMGSGKGRYAGRGIKGQKSRAGSHKMPAGFEGGQTRLFMRLPKLPGNTSKDAMPIGPFRTATQAVNVGDIERVYRSGEAVTIETLLEKGLIKNTKVDVKILGDGELKKKLSFTAHRFSKGALAKIKAAGGSATALRAEEPPPAAKKKRRQPSQADEATEPNEGVEVIEAVEATETVDS